MTIEIITPTEDELVEWVLKEQLMVRKQKERIIERYLEEKLDFDQLIKPEEIVKLLFDNQIPYVSIRVRECDAPTI